MAVATRDEREREASLRLPRLAVLSHIALLPAGLIATLALQLITVSHFFYFDDYVPFGEIATNGGRTYVWNLLTASDLTPNWRPLPGLLYLGSYEFAGMNPLPVHIITLALHVGAAALLYYVIWRTTGRAWAACVAALVFGLNPAYVGALSQVTTATQEMAGFFLIATLAAVLECALAADRRRSMIWLGAAFVLCLLVIGSHEGMAIMFPVFGLAFLMFDPRPEGRLLRSVLRTAPFAVAGLATAGTFVACGCNEGTSVWGTANVWNQTLIYAGRLVYPIGLESPQYVQTAHVVGAAALAAVALAACIFGPKVARLGTLWIILALIPHIFIQYATASRYLYIPAIGFALLAGAVAVMLAEPLAKFSPRLAVAALAPVFALLLGWYAYQTVQQDQPFAAATDDWQQFHRDVTRVFPTVPPHTRVMIIGGPFQRYDYQIYILPAFAQTTWGSDVTLEDLEPGSLPAQLALVSQSPYLAEYRDGTLVRLHDDNAGH